MKIKEKILIKFTIIITICLILSGCWDNKELDTISIVTGVGIDAADKEDEINLILQISKIGQNNSQMNHNSNTDDNSIILEAEEKGILSAIEKLQRQTTRELFLHHNQVIIFGNEQAVKGIKPYIDALLRQYEMRMETLVFISEDKVKDIFNGTMEQDKVSSLGISRMVESARRQTEAYAVRVLDIVSMIIDETSAPIIPIVKLRNEDGTPMIFLSGLAVFREGKLIGQLNEIETSGYTWIMNKFKTTVIEVDVEEGFSNMNITDIKYKMRPEIRNGNELVISLDIMGNAIISEIQGFDDMTINEVTDILIREGENAIYNEIQACLNKSKELNADFLRFGVEFYKRFPNQFEDIRDDWDDILSEVEISADIKLNLVDTGKIVNSLNMKEGN